jgi:opacity protein-like surface antigen
MKKVLLSTVAFIAFAAPAAAADLAARPYTKAPPAPIAVVYDWSGFYIGANGGWGSSRKCWDFTDAAGAFVAAEGWAIAGRPAPGCSVLKARATGPTSRAAMRA